MTGSSTNGASRDGYGRALLRLADDPNVVVLEADLGKSTKSCYFRSEYPNRTVSLGIAEQNMMLVAAGMASSGKTPFASTFARLHPSGPGRGGAPSRAVPLSPPPQNFAGCPRGYAKRYRACGGSPVLCRAP